VKPYYQDSAVTIFCGDCREIVPTLGRFDLLLTDPPYDLPQEAKASLHAMFRERANGVIVFMPPENQWHNPADQYGFWVKVLCPRNISKKYSRFVDMILFYGNLKWRRGLGRYWTQYTNVFQEQLESSRVHPFAKPESLLRRLIRNHTDAGVTVLDPFCGGGSTLFAAKQTGRKAVGVEIEERYCELAARRCSQEMDFGTANKALSQTDPN